MKRCSAVALLFLLGSLAFGQNTTGTWNLYPPQATVNQVSIDPPINVDGSSVWSSKATVPVQYDVLAGYGPVVFSSLCPPGDVCTPSTPFYGGTYSNLAFAPNPALTFEQITNLTAVYTFTLGNCHGGSLRWQVDTNIGNLQIYYGATPNFTDCTTVNQSGINMLSLTDARFDTSQITGGTFYDTYAHALTLLTGQAVTSAALVLDSGWGGSQVISSLGNVIVNDNTFVPKTGSSPVCPTAPATIQVSTIGPSGSLTIDEVLSNVPNDTGNQFRIVDCKYQYNIAGKSLGKGQFKVDLLINGVPVVQTGSGTVFALK